MENAIVELAGDYGIPDIENYVLQIDFWSKVKKLKISGKNNKI